MDLALLEKALLGLFAAIVLAIVVSKLTGKRFKLPPGPYPMPIVGNWLQVGILTIQINLDLYIENVDIHLHAF